MRISKSSQALIDLVEGTYIAEDNPEAADRFFDAFEESVEVIRKTPKIGTIRKFRGHTEIRMWFVRGFEKSLIFYTENSEEIVILRVIHASRDYNRVLTED